MDEKIPAYVQSVLDAVPDEDIRSIVEQAGALIGSNEGRLQVAAQSGLALGVELAFRDMYDTYDTALSGLCAAIEKIDAITKDSKDAGLIRMLAGIRNSMAKAVDICTHSVTDEERVRGVVTTFGLPEELCQQDVRDVGEFSIPTSGIMALGIARRWPEMFQAYVCLKEDRTLSCKCPWHTLGAWRDLPNEEQTRRFDKAMEEYIPGTERCHGLVQEFVQWWVNSARNAYKATAPGGEEQLKPPLISEAESRLMTDDLWATLGVGVKKP
jgi:hypothetical protein